jgi:hypothetical protein
MVVFPVVGGDTAAAAFGLPFSKLRGEFNSIEANYFRQT